MDKEIQELLQQIALENFFVKSSKGNYLSVTKNGDTWIAQGKEVRRQQDIEYLNKQYENNLKDLTKTYNDLMDELQYGLWDSGNLSIAQNEILNYLLEQGIIIRTPGVPGEHDTINGTAKWIYSLNENTEPAKNKMYRDIATKEAKSKEEFLQILKEDELDNVNQIANIMDNNSDTQINYSRVRKELYQYGDVYIWTDKIPVNKLIIQDEDLVVKEINGLKYQGLEIDENTKPIIVLGNWDVIDGRHRTVRAKKQGIPTLSGYVPADIWYDLEIKNNINEAGYNWNKGMSNNAVQAYNNGEMPISKWNKSILLETFKKELNNIDNKYLIDTYSEIIENKNVLYHWLEEQNKEKLQKLLLDKSSWHHTSSYYNETDFYKVDIEIALDKIYQNKEFEKVLNSLNESMLFKQLKSYNRNIFIKENNMTNNYFKRLNEKLEKLLESEYFNYEEFEKIDKLCDLDKSLTESGNYLALKDSMYGIYRYVKTSQKFNGSWNWSYKLISPKFDEALDAIDWLAQDLLSNNTMQDMIACIKEGSFKIYDQNLKKILGVENEEEGHLDTNPKWPTGNNKGIDPVPNYMLEPNKSKANNLRREYIQAHGKPYPYENNK